MSCRKPIRWSSYCVSVGYLVLTLLLSLPVMGMATARADEGITHTKKLTGETNETAPLPEVVVRLGLRGVGEIDIIALQQDSILYIPVLELFDFLHVNAEAVEQFSRIKGFYLSPERTYDIEPDRGRMRVGAVSLPLTTRDAVKAYSDIYLSVAMFRQAFGIELQYDPVHLYVHIRGDAPFPVELLKKEMQTRRLDRGQARKPVEHTLGRDRRIFGGGMLDWQLAWRRNDRAGDQYTGVFRGGVEFLGGDLSGTVTVRNTAPIDWGKTPWRWRYVAEDAPWFRQAVVGWMGSDLGVRTSMLGASVSSQHYVVRKDFTPQEYTSSALPGEEVELYVGNRLVDIVRVDSSGSYTFLLPLRHGGNYFRIRRLDRFGVSSSSEMRVDIPFDFLHPGEVQYRASAGRLQYHTSSGIAEAWSKMGIGGRLNVGLGVQAVRHTKDLLHPAVFGSARLLDNVWLDGTYLHDASESMQASFSTVGNLSLRASAQRVHSHPLYNAGEEFREYRGMMSLPLPFLPWRAWMSMFGQHREYTVGITRSLFNQITVGSGRVSVALTTQGRWYDRTDSRDIDNALNLGAVLVHGLHVSAGAVYSHTMGRFSSARVVAQYSLGSSSHLSAQWYGNLLRGGSQFQASFVLRLPEVTSETRGDYQSENGGWNVQQRVDGTLGYDEGTSDILFFNRQWVDRAAMTIIPFLDDNASGAFDPGELVLDSPVQAWVLGGQRHSTEADDHTRFVNLDQYDTYRVSLDQAGFVDPVWVPMYREIDVVADPNRFKAVYLPVYLGGEVQGSVMHMAEGVTRPQRGVRVLFHRLDRAQQDVQTNTYLDGSFQYFGLAPGRYSAAPDTVQLAALGYRSEPPQREFTVRSKESGDLVEGIDFLLYRSALPPGDTLGPIVEERVERLPDTAIIVVPPIAQLDTVKTPPTVQPDERPEIVARDTAAVAFVPLPFGSSRSIPINLATSGIDSASQAWIDRLVETVRDLRNYTVVVEGHADNFGSFQENQQRSEQRAQRILQLLTDRGVPRERIQVQSFGSRRPVAPNTSAEGRRRNNRADVKLLGTGAAQPSRPMRQQETPRPPTSERAVDSLVFRPPDVVDPAQGSTAASVVLEIEHSGGALDAAGRRNIEGLLRVLREQPRAVLQIEGHSDNFGSMEASQQRSQARADRVLAHVLAQGITRERVQVRAFGSRRPVASNRTAEGRRQNNRVELRVIVP